jgi:hypothetical protein
MLDESNTLFKLLIDKSEDIRTGEEFMHLIVSPFNIKQNSLI